MNQDIAERAMGLHSSGVAMLFEHPGYSLRNAFHVGDDHKTFAFVFVSLCFLSLGFRLIFLPFHFINGPLWVPALHKGLRDSVLLLYFVLLLCHYGVLSIKKGSYNTKFLVKRVVGVELQILVGVCCLSIDAKFGCAIRFSDDDCI